MKNPLIVSLAVAIASAAIGAHAQPARITEQGCMVATDMALVARALAQHGVARTAADRVMAAIYLDDGEPTVIDLRRRVTEAGYRRRGSPQDMAREIYTRCMGSGGDLEQTFGREI